jgi:hypothetical protein
MESGSNPDQYDLISEDLEQHILKHAEGAACLALLYELYDCWTGHTLFEETRRAEAGRKSRQRIQDAADAAATWYLNKATELIKKKRCASYTELSVQLCLAAQTDPSARSFLRSDETIRRYLNEAARLWYPQQALTLLKRDPEMEAERLVTALIEDTRGSNSVFALSRPTDVAKYIGESSELWYVRKGLRAIKADPSTSRIQLAEQLRGEAVREAEEHFRPLELVTAYLENAGLGAS